MEVTEQIDRVETITYTTNKKHLTFYLQLTPVGVKIKRNQHE